jgi:phytoene synthase
MNDALRASHRFCGALARREARNFYYSFLLLPPSLRRSMCALYAFLRHTDDLADEPGGPAEKQAALREWRASLDRALAGAPAEPWPGLLAFADTVARHEIPRQYLNDVLDGVEMDLHPQVYATFDDLYVYCYRVASAVGLCCIRIWGYQSEEGRAEALAESCGIALQLTNILRDVREDAERGRIYLPQDDLALFEVTAEDLLADHPSDAVRRLLEFEGRRAQQFYEAAEPLAELVSPVGRPVLRTIAGIYRALLGEIARRDYDVQSGRVALPAWRKLAIASRSLAGRFTRRPHVRQELSR